MAGLRHGAVIVAAIVVWILGALWYSMLATWWTAGIGKTEEQLMQQSGGSPVVAYALGFVAIVVSCYALAWLIGRLDARSLRAGAKVGLAAAVFPVANLALNYAFEMRPVSLWLINGGYASIGLAMAGAIIGGWTRRAAA